MSAKLTLADIKDLAFSEEDFGGFETLGWGASMFITDRANSLLLERLNRAGMEVYSSLYNWNRISIGSDTHVGRIVAIRKIENK